MTAGNDPHAKSAGSEIAPSLEPFDRAFILVLGYEGGYGNDPEDQGGETKYGISKARFPDIDIKTLTIDGAKALYKEHFWNLFHCGEMPWPLGFAFFDCVVQFKPKNPIRWLQGALKVTQDGILGPNTLLAAKECQHVETALLKMMHERSDYRVLRPNHGHFGSGWRKRDLAVVMDAIRFWGK